MPPKNSLFTNSKPKPGKLNGYGKQPRRVVAPAPHQHLVRWPADADGSLRLLRDRDGYAVARRHGDLRPGEISLVLE